MKNEESWSAEVSGAVVDITPEWPVRMAANGNPEQETVGVEDRLEANILLFSMSTEPILLVSFDLLYVGPSVRNLLRDSLSDLIPNQRILLFATHTHSAPATDPTKPLLGVADENYIQKVAGDVADAVRGLFKTASGDRAMVEAAIDSVSMGINRRKTLPIWVTRKGARFGAVGGGANPKGPRDDVVTVLTIRSEVTSRPLAIIWNYACHPVGHPGTGLVSAHYPGWVRRGIRADEALPHLPILFLQGFSGDIRPSSPSTNAPTARRWRRWIQEPGYSGFNRSDYESWCSGLSAKVRGIVKSPGTRIRGSGLSIENRELPRGDFVVGAATDGPVEFASVTLGDNVGIVGIGAELVAAYSKYLREAAAGEWILPSGCLGDVVGYVPTSEMLSQGGYEAGGFCPSLSCTAVAPRVEESTMAGLASVLRTDSD